MNILPIFPLLKPSKAQPLKTGIQKITGLLLAVFSTLFLAIPAVASPDLTPFQTAYQHRYTWDRNFPGYRAEVSINYDGELDQGIIEVYPDYHINIINIDRPEVENFILNRLERETLLRRPIPFSQRHDLDNLSLVHNSDGSTTYREIGFGGIAEYTIAGDRIEQVRRSQHDRTLILDTIATADTPEGYLPIQYEVTLTDNRSGNIVQREDVRNFYEKIGPYYLLTYQALRYDTEGDPIDKPAPQRLLRFNDVQPL